MPDSVTTIIQLVKNIYFYLKSFSTASTYSSVLIILHRCIFKCQIELTTGRGTKTLRDITLTTHFSSSYTRKLPKSNKRRYSIPKLNFKARFPRWQLSCFFLFFFAAWLLHSKRPLPRSCNKVAECCPTERVIQWGCVDGLRRPPVACCSYLSLCFRMGWHDLVSPAEWLAVSFVAVLFLLSYKGRFLKGLYLIRTVFVCLIVGIAFYRRHIIQRACDQNRYHVFYQRNGKRCW